MEDNTQLFESLWERTIEYGKTNIELIKLKLLDKVSDLISSLIPPVIVFSLVGFFLFFLSFGLAFWLGEIIGNAYYGYFLVAALYGIVAIIVHLFIHNRIKKIVSDYIIRKLLK